EPEHPMNAAQAARFRAILARLPPAATSLANSAGLHLGPGFASDILPRLGEPYVTSRPQGKARLALAAQIAAATSRSRDARAETAIAPSQGGMGLGFFIARTLLERTGGVVSVGQGLPRPDGGSDTRSPLRGARVAVRWARPALEVAS
ncbi:MAG: hypothetical protein ACK4OJ_04990, partial [Brevundimonas sp.]